MAVRITMRHMVGGTRHEHIAKVKWINESTGTSGEETRAGMVAWLSKSRDNVAYVKDVRGNVIRVGVVRPQNGEPYIRTYADDTWTDNLLSLPEY